MLLLENAERHLNFNYAHTGISQSPKPTIYNPGISIPTLGIVRTEDAIAGDCYLVERPDDQILAEEIRLVDGSLRYAFDQRNNPNSIIFLHGGFHSGILLYGKIGTISDTPISTEIFKLFLSVIKSRFAKKKVATTLDRRRETSRKQGAA